MALEHGWRVSEYQFYEDEGCRQELEPSTLMSGPNYDLSDAPPSAPDNRCRDLNYNPAKATDDFFNTLWVANCCPCQAYDAYIGGDFGIPVVVQCAKIWQSVSPYYSPEITLSKEGTILNFNVLEKFEYLKSLSITTNFV